MVICVTANLQLTGWLTAMQLDVTGFALLLEHERGDGAISPTEIGIALSSPTRFEGRRTRLVKEQWTFRMSSSSAQRGNSPASRGRASRGLIGTTYRCSCARERRSLPRRLHSPMTVRFLPS
ncbi:hypothetical protein WJ21_24365 [Burkholderia vietnamiensis]|nr:hypothetical protein WJ09_21220 [Burkholderia vietnamiensis]KVF94468.1 hypothetical protein WJ21_24365 [Burkholderia vietnamiensis]